MLAALKCGRLSHRSKSPELALTTPNAGERRIRATAGFIERPSQASKAVNDGGYPLIESQSHNSVAHDLADIRNSVASDHTGDEIIEKREFHVGNSLSYFRIAIVQQ